MVQGRSKEEIKLYLRTLIAESKRNKVEKNATRWNVELSSVTKRVQEKMESIMKMKKWNKVAEAVVTTVLVWADSLTVLADKDVTYGK